MKVYIFFTDSRPRVVALTADKIGANLPPEYAWRTVDGGNAGNLISIGSADIYPAAATVKRDGYMLAIEPEDGPASKHTISAR
jgi:hypothetical protein